jgi:GNAT superfamily N-acetyltransferase
MTDPLVVEMMSEKAILWRCLHDGSLTADSIEKWDRNGEIPWAEYRARNLPLLKNLTDTYGACAVVAHAGELFVGHLRFCPKAVRELADPGLGLCLQQEFPSGPSGDFGRRTFPPLEEIEDKTLLVHCMMLAAEEPGRESCRRKGIGTRMARALVAWATMKGWHAVEATAYEALPVIYAASGQAGRSFWEGLGFRLARAERVSALEAESEFVRTMREEASAQGVDPTGLANKYIMRLDLRREGGS